jgi:ceramide glucosyltransferase
MLVVLPSIGIGFLLAAAVAGIAYLAAAAGCVVAFRRRPPRPPGDFAPPVTVLKPVCGLDHGLEDNLRSFCDQDYPAYQVVFGVRDPGDPAIPAIRRMIEALAGRDVSLVVGGGTAGGNPKAENLAHMLPAARHGIFVVADSDMRVGRDYLRAVVAPFSDPRVGATTCLYAGNPAPGLASRLGALYINDWFLPSVLVALAFQDLRFCFGATMAVRREALESIGGFEALAPYLADDYMLGEMVSRRGLEVRLAPYVVENVVFEPGVRSLLAHELRWARTIRACRPAGYAVSFVGSGAITTATLFLLSTGGSSAGIALVSAAAALRTALHYAVRAAVPVPVPAAPWLLPVRDLLCLGVWAASFLGRSVSWRENRLSVRPDGRLLGGERSLS